MSLSLLLFPRISSRPRIEIIEVARPGGRYEHQLPADDEYRSFCNPHSLAVEHWSGIGWVIVDNDVKPADDGQVDCFYRLYAHGFASKRDAQRWMTVIALARSTGAQVSHGDFYQVPW